MASQAGISLKVTPEILVSTAGQVKGSISKTEASFRNLEAEVKSVRSFWEGDGANQFVQAFLVRSDRINTSIRRFMEDVNDLEKMAGVYVAAENSAKETIELLSSDVII
ncbi:MAG: WXG100 family type VII secretion target [Eubacterium sp.]|nr:WXG100 family type VII secretion target [Eubacterium sp.]MBR4241802.1 WXG100 family type VII secretion target [Eubacterium sp.]